METMQRYSGQELTASPHIVVLGSCKVGNFVVSTPTLRGLKARFPDSTLGFIGSDVTADFEEAHSSIDWRVSWDSSGPNSGLKLIQELHQRIFEYGPVQLAVNLDGFNPVTCTLVPWLQPIYVAGGSLASNLRRSLAWGHLPQHTFLADQDWDSPDFLSRYQGVFHTNYIAELFAQLAFIYDYTDPTFIDLPSAAPPFVVPDLLIHCTSARAAKVWPAEYWRQVIMYASSLSLSVGLIGSPPSIQQQAYNAGDIEQSLLDSTPLIDLRGRTSLIELAGACRISRGVISVDAGPLHIAAAVGARTFAIIGNDAEGNGASPMRLWLPRCSNVTRSIAPESCTLCVENRFKNDDCLLDDHPCMASIQPEQVTDWINHLNAQV